VTFGDNLGGEFHCDRAAIAYSSFQSVYTEVKATFGPVQRLEPIFTGATEDEQGIIENIHLVFLCH